MSMHRCKTVEAAGVYAMRSHHTLLVYVMPGSPAAMYNRSFPVEKQALNQQYGLGKPWPASFFAWLFDPDDMFSTVFDDDNVQTNIPKGVDFTIGPLHIRGSGILTGDFGVTERVLGARFIPSQPINDVIGSRWLNSLLMVGFALVLAVLVAIPIGIIAAIKQGSRLDHILTLVTFTGFSIPPFMLGLILAVLFGILPYQFRNCFGWDWLPYLPGALASTSSDSVNNVFDRLYHLILPVTTLALPQIALLSRQLRFSMLEVLGHDYIRTAWAKGLSLQRVVLKHIFRNALIPIITTVGLMMPVVLSGAIMVESVFGYPGMGQLYYKALGGCLVTSLVGEFACPPGQTLLPLDFPLTLAITLMLIVAVALANMLVDILYTLVDPRISYK